LVAKEVRQGLVSAEGARRYGVVVAADGTMDPRASTALRDAMSAKRGETLPVFNFGPGIEALRESCEAETGLPAPQPPVWQPQSLAE